MEVPPLYSSQFHSLTNNNSNHTHIYMHVHRYKWRWAQHLGNNTKAIISHVIIHYFTLPISLSLTVYIFTYIRLSRFIPRLWLFKRTACSFPLDTWPAHIRMCVVIKYFNTHVMQISVTRGHRLLITKEWDRKNGQKHTGSSVIYTHIYTYIYM